MIAFIIIQVLILIILIVFMINNWHEYLKDKKSLHKINKNERNN